MKDITDLIKDSTQSQEQAREALNDPNLGKKLSNVENVVKNFNKLPVSLQGKFTSTYMDTITTPLEKNYSFLKKETNADKIDNEESAD
ncbi:hypothetical protein IJM86_00965 [bacterium]|nr:hypothetical protein [bacterium]